MLKKIMVTVVTAGLLLGSLQAKSLRDVLGSSLDHMNRGAPVLDLTDRHLTEITPKEVQLLAKNYPKLTKLYIENNELSGLPGEIGDLTKLEVLNLHNNELTSLPESIGNLTKLTSLRLHNNELTSLPVSIGKLTNLTLLWLSNNRLSQHELDSIRTLLPGVQIIADNQRPRTRAMRQQRKVGNRRLHKVVNHRRTLA